MGRYLGLDDLPASKAQPERDIAGELVELIVDHRDALLIDALVSIHEARSTEPIAVAVVYGAGHMPAVVRALLARYGYRPRAADWLTVFDF
jgi:pheromone shutdown protein TraB